jgi:hypothetical protein
MVELNMSPASLGSRLTLGPAPWFRLERHELREGPTERLVGTLRNQQWNVAGQHFIDVQATPGSTLHFEGPAGPVASEMGPFEFLSMADGALYGDGQVIARFDEDTYLWRSATTQEAWPSLVVRLP